METLEQLRDRLLARFPGAEVTLVPNGAPSAQTSLLLGHAHAVAIATFLRDDPALRLDYCSNVTGIDWPDKEVVDTTKVSVPDPANPAGPPKLVEQKTKRLVPGCLETVYHLYSMALKQGPVILRLRTANRTDQAVSPSLTPVWRACEFQDREAFALFGIIYSGHPDLRRILMWDEFKDFPMRKDYVEPDDYEWEPTPHGPVHDTAKKHYPAPPAAPSPAAPAKGATP